MEEAIVREIKEELNCNIRVIKYLGSVYHEYETFNITLNGLLCEMIDNHLELREHVDICWVDKVELVKLNFAGADLKLIKAIEL